MSNKHLLQEAATKIANLERCWLVTVINTCGSTPTRIGMKMLVTEQEDLHGTIGGGAVERNTINKIRKEQPSTITKWCFDLDGNDNLIPTGMICGGTQELLIEPLFNNELLYIIGGGHCGQALSELASRCNFAVTILDNRPEIAQQKKLPFANRIICTDYQKINQHISPNPNNYIVIMTHGHKHDQNVIEQVLPITHKYCGVIGSKNKTEQVFNNLLAKGHAKTSLKKIYSPIGFAIGSQTPMEVAISILAQLIAVKNNKKAIPFNSNTLLNGGTD
jgi:xanthine dehydrogenase accessory factor